MFAIGLRTKKRVSASKPKPSQPVKVARQTYLDFGQSKFGSETCTICGMVYTLGIEDEKHVKFCKSRTSDIIWKVSEEAQVAMDFGESGKVVVAVNSDPRCKRIRLLVDEALGYCEAADFSRETTRLVFIQESRAIGYLEADPIDEETPLFKASDNSLIQTTERVSFGVLKIWVHPDERRKGVASKLIDAARAHFGYPAAVAKSSVAFSPTTDAGKGFAQSYMGTEHFAVYKL